MSSVTTDSGCCKSLTCGTKSWTTWTPCCRKTCATTPPGTSDTLSSPTPLGSLMMSLKEKWSRSFMTMVDLCWCFSVNRCLLWVMKHCLLSYSCSPCFLPSDMVYCYISLSVSFSLSLSLHSPLPPSHLCYTHTYMHLHLHACSIMHMHVCMHMCTCTQTHSLSFFTHW